MQHARHYISTNKLLTNRLLCCFVDLCPEASLHHTHNYENYNFANCQHAFAVLVLPNNASKHVLYYDKNDRNKCIILMYISPAVLCHALR